MVETGAPSGTMNLLSTMDKLGSPSQILADLPQYIGGYGSTFGKEEAQNKAVIRFVFSDDQFKFRLSFVFSLFFG